MSIIYKGKTIATGDTSFTISDVVTQVENGVKDIEDKRVESLGSLNTKTNDGLAALGNASDALRQTQITNCILSVEELVKVEPLTSGRLELKAGSIVYVSTNGTFNEVTISSNVSAGSTALFTQAGTRELFCCYVPSKNELVTIPVNETYSQATAPTTFLVNLYGGWYDTTNKIMKYTYDGGATWTICSLPFVMGTPSTIGAGGTGWIGNIKQIFNGYGYVGQYTFTTRGLKYLVPNGRNADKTLNNIEINTNSLTLLSSIGLSSKIGFLNLQYGLSTYGVTNYFVQDTPPTGFSGSAKWLNTEENIMYATSDSGATWNMSSGTYFGIITKAGNGNITEIKPNKPVEFVKTTDLDRELELKISASGDTMTGTLQISQSTNKPIRISSQTIDITSTPTNNQYSMIEFLDKNNQRIGIIGGVQLTNGHYGVYMQSGNSGGIQVRTDGTTTYATAPTPPAGDNSTKIATTAYCVNMRCTTKATTTSSASITRPCWVVQNYVNGTSWYRVWSDGWCEQGGETTNTGHSIATVTFLKPFVNNNFTVLAVKKSASGRNENNQASWNIQEKTLTSFKYAQGDTNGQGCEWQASGYIN